MTKSNIVLTVIIMLTGAVALMNLLMTKVVTPIVAHIWWNS